MARVCGSSRGSTAGVVAVCRKWITRITHAYELNAPWNEMAPSARLTRKVRSRLLAQYLMIMQSCCARGSFCTYAWRRRVLRTASSLPMETSHCSLEAACLSFRIGTRARSIASTCANSPDALSGSKASARRRTSSCCSAWEGGGRAGTSSVRSRSAPCACSSHAVEPKSCMVEPGTAHPPSSCSRACTSSRLSPSRGLRLRRQLRQAAPSFLRARASSTPGRTCLIGIEFIVALLEPSAAASLAEQGEACMLLAAYILVAEVGELFEVMGRMPQSLRSVSAASSCWPSTCCVWYCNCICM
mmetsp:Transcript_31162/g.79580  ORF Transcript_31162/g.79580 Transcript_31162/m.79580 type:complete len:301 (-) Transcript_31162:395-1297(-)